MSTRVVIDASVWASNVITQEDHHEASHIWLKSFIAAGGNLIAPAFILIEVAAAVSRVTGQATLAQQAVADLRSLEKAFFVPLDAVLVLGAIDIASNLHLRAGDAIYVALAHQQNIPLVSWDKEQVERTKGLIIAYTPHNYPL